MSTQLGAYVMPQSMEVRGQPHFERQKQRMNGAGGWYSYGEQSMTWEWPYLSDTEYAWLIAHYTETTFHLYDNTNTEQTFTGGSMTYPTHEKMDGSLVMKVRIEFHLLTPLL